jgi:hypothetical protein
MKQNGVRSRHGIYSVIGVGELFNNEIEKRY